MSLNQPAPVFVLGSPRSGTTVLSGVLNKLDGVHITRETSYLADVYQPECDDLHDWSDTRLEEFLCRIRTYLIPNRWQNQPNVDGYRVFQRAFPTPGYAGLVRYIWQLEDDTNYAALQHIGDNTPRYILAIPLLQQLFPDARFIHIVRDGRDVVCSVRGRRFGANSLLLAARSWMDHIGCWQLAERTIPEEQRLELHYEELVAKPAEVQQRLAQFLDTSIAKPVDNAEHCDRHNLASVAEHHERLQQPIDQSSVGRHHSDLSDSQLQEIEAMMYPGLVAYGYDVGPFRPSTLLLERNLRLTGSHLSDLVQRAGRRFRFATSATSPVGADRGTNE